MSIASTGTRPQKKSSKKGDANRALYLRAACAGARHCHIASFWRPKDAMKCPSRWDSTAKVANDCKRARLLPLPLHPEPARAVGHLSCGEGALGRSSHELPVPPAAARRIGVIIMQAHAHRQTHACMTAAARHIDIVISGVWALRGRMLRLSSPCAACIIVLCIYICAPRHAAQLLLRLRNSTRIRPRTVP